MARVRAKRFITLPPELRMMIFQAAASPSRPLLHRFGIREDEDYDRLLLTAPGPWPPLEHSILALNEPASSSSAYYHDEGLWGACRESRAAIYRHYRETMNEHVRVDALHEQDPEGGVWTPRRYARLLSGPFRAENEDMGRTLTVIPKTDLICFRVEDDQDVGVFFDPAWWGARGAGHDIAFEYEAASWGFDVETADMDRMLSAPGARAAFLHFLWESVDVMKMQADGDEGAPTLPRIFLVDRAIRGRNVNWMKSGGHEWEFYGAGGERYVDVTARAGDGRGGRGMDALAFLDAINTFEDDWVIGISEEEFEVVDWHNYVTVLTCCESQS